MCDLTFCGRNAECKSDNHVPSCSCQSGFFGNAKDDKIGCQPIECETNDECSDEKICDLYKCRIACLAHNPCGVNAICTAEKHTQVRLKEKLYCFYDISYNLGLNLYEYM